MRSRSASGKVKKLIVQKATESCICRQCKTPARPEGRLFTKEQLRTHLRYAASRNAYRAQPYEDSSSQGPEIEPEDQQYTQEGHEYFDDAMNADPFEPGSEESRTVGDCRTRSEPSFDVHPPQLLWPNSSEGQDQLEDGAGPSLDTITSHTCEKMSDESSDTITSSLNLSTSSVTQPTPPSSPPPPPSNQPLALPPTEDNAPDPMQVDGDCEASRTFQDTEDPDSGISIADLRIPLSPAPLPNTPTQEPWLCYLGVHANAAVRGIVLLLLHMHARYQLPHIACACLATMLYTLLEHCFVLASPSTFTPATAPPRTLRTMYKRMGMWDRFEVKTLCPACWELQALDEEELDADLFEDFGPSDQTNSSRDWQRFCRRCKEPLYAKAAKSGYIRPRKQAPYDLFSLQLTECLAQPGYEDACEKYLDDNDTDGVYTRIQQGSVWRNMKCPDGTRFFPRSRTEALQQSELRLGVLLSVDWFNPNQSTTAESHSSGPLSLCIANLPPELRFRVHNLSLIGILPGPREPTCEELQRFLRPCVDDLLRLWEEGIVIKTPKHPQGRIIRVALLAAICDHPGLCKLCGFTDQRHNARPCTQCEISRADMFQQGWKAEAYPLRDGELHKRRAARMYALQQSNAPKSKIDDYLKRYGCRWSELCRLPYFDPVTMGVLDPMHMLLQGLTKTTWYHNWVQGGKEHVKVLREATKAGKKRELDEIHEVLRTYEMPSWYARLPTKVGYPAGGSLTSDEWRALAVVYGPAVLPPILIKAHEQSLLEDERKALREEILEAKRQAKQAQTVPLPSKTEEHLPTNSADSLIRVHRDTAKNYLKLATVLKIYMRREITERDIERASSVYLDFFEEYVQIYGQSNVTPTFHWITHMPAQIHRYGPVHGFWTFLFERLNKVLKSIQTSGHKGGVVEVTFAREFKREISLTRMCSVLAIQQSDWLARFFASQIKKYSRDIARTGTLAAIALEAEQEAEEAGERRCERSRNCIPSGTGKMQFLEDSTQKALLVWYGRQYPDVPIRFGADGSAPWGSIFLANRAKYFPELRLDGKRIVTANEAKHSKSDSLVSHRVSSGLQWVGELRGLFEHHQTGIGRPHTFAEVAWLVPLQNTPKHADLYRDFPELEVNFWEYCRYLSSSDDWEPDRLILAEDIVGPAARCKVEIGTQTIWITTGMSKSGRSL